MVADPAHFRPDPDPTGAHQESIQTSEFFSYQSDFFRYLNVDYFYLKNWENLPGTVENLY